MKALWSVPGLALMFALLAGCVTINIYFPTAAAEEAARAIVRDALQVPDAESTPESEPGARLDAPEVRQAAAANGTPVVAWVLERLVSPAAAQSPNLQIETPAINRIRASIRERAPQLSPHLRSGAIGFGNNGDVVIRDLSEIPLRDRSTVQRLVSEENSDRDSLYREIARANDRPDWERQIRETFARVWVEEAPSGYWYQDRNGQWQQK
ncbi:MULTISPECIES: YdbL family protein [unclassified Thioalkalivibrio]|uniref:YdbL family protein n=1 Tax=unclassified Thioalkalivibrio TaxID=2621013 RepID=UPI000370675F|nr:MULTISPECIES: YdbL family protein [unclassified Thioalkalivibrio]